MKTKNKPKMLLFFSSVLILLPCYGTEFVLQGRRGIIDDVRIPRTMQTPEPSEDAQPKSLIELCTKKIIEITHAKLIKKEQNQEEDPIAALQTLYGATSSLPKNSKATQALTKLLKESNLIDIIGTLGERLTKEERSLINRHCDDIEEIGKKFYHEAIPFINAVLNEEPLPPLTNSRLDQIKALGALTLIIHTQTKQNIQGLREALEPSIDYAIETKNHEYLQLLIHNNIFCYCNLDNLTKLYFKNHDENVLDMLQHLNLAKITNPHPYLNEEDLNITIEESKFPNYCEPCCIKECRIYPQEFLERLIITEFNHFINEDKHYATYDELRFSDERIRQTKWQKVIDDHQILQVEMHRILTLLIGNCKILDPYLISTHSTENPKEKPIFIKMLETKMQKFNDIKINSFLQRNIALLLRVLREHNKYVPTKDETITRAWECRSWRYILRDAYPDYFTPDVCFSKKELFHPIAEKFIWDLWNVDTELPNNDDHDYNSMKRSFRNLNTFHGQYDTDYPLFTEIRDHSKKNYREFF